MNDPMKNSERLILIAEDETDLAQLVAFHLGRRGFRTMIALDGSSAMELLKKHRPDLAILDVMMPGMDGLEVCWQIKMDDPARRIPVILLTAKASVDDKLRGFGCGADDYVTKPFAISELIVRIYALLRREGKPEEGEMLECVGKS